MAEEITRGEGRHSILELSPLELACMKALWPRGEGSVRDIQEALLPIVPRAYTTIMTILDRLAQKGVVARQKAGKAWVYRANLSADEARAHAVAQVVAGFFDGSAEALVAHLAAPGGELQVRPRREVGQRDAVPQQRAPANRRLAAEDAKEPSPEPLPAKPRVAVLDTTLL